MTRVLALAVVIAWIGAGASSGAPQTWTGVSSDSTCGGSHGGEVDERECTQKCVRNGDQYVLVTDFGGKVWPIANQDFAALREHPGATVKLTGELKGGAIVVAHLEKR